MTTSDVWMQADGVGWRQARSTSRESALEYIAAFGGVVEIHDGECGLGRSGPSARCSCQLVVKIEAAQA